MLVGSARGTEKPQTSRVWLRGEAGRAARLAGSASRTHVAVAEGALSQNVPRRSRDAAESCLTAGRDPASAFHPRDVNRGLNARHPAGVAADPGWEEEA